VVEEWASNIQLTAAQLFTTRTWTFRPDAVERGHAVLEDLHRVATTMPNVSLRLFQDQDQPHRFVTVGTWPDRAAFQAFREHPEMEEVHAALADVLDEAHPVDGAIVMAELVD
jgi:quinol monooxygenase YgiN